MGLHCGMGNKVETASRVSRIQGDGWDSVATTS